MGNGYIVCSWENATERLDKVIVEINVDHRDDQWKPDHPCFDGIGFCENPLLLLLLLLCTPNNQLLTMTGRRCRETARK